jgi:glycosyltransferase involved in cell wall biosynthesis
MKLAVVIPAFKREFFAKALDSLARQTCKDFTVYVGDDDSPHALEEVVKPFRDRLDIHYTRFTENLGGKDLVAQWTRCVELTRGEDWIWLFSDDDLASSNCVELFYSEMPRRRGDVYRFNTRVIDEHDEQTSGTLSSPDFETSERMAYHLLYWRRGNSMPDHIFSRDVYQRKGGFVRTAYAQGADWATSILFSQDTGMHVLQDGMISWRRSASNVSAVPDRKKRAMMLGHYQFIGWVLRHFSHLQQTPVDGISFEMIRQAAANNLREVIVQHYRGLPPALYLFHLRFLKRHFRMPVSQAIRHLGSTLYNTSRSRQSPPSRILWNITNRIRGRA